MKVVTKVIANRVKELLPDIVSEEQSAFVKGRLITDNALIAMDCFHWMKNKKIGKKGVMAFKLDMSKAYDRIEWDFVEGALEAFNFPHGLIHLIKRWMIHNTTVSKDLHGIKVARKAPTISYLFFADDSLLSSRANEEEADKILRELIRRKLGFKAVGSHTRDLGLPIVFGRSKKEVFSLVVERVWKKVKGWKEVLIKAVAQAIPTYIMSCYKLPDSCCDEIEAMLARFWWGSKDGERKIHWMSWNRMVRSKSEGGMGFRGFMDLNTNLLSKQFWRLLNGDGSLMVRFFKGRYYLRSSIAEVGLGFKPSYAWRSILSTKEAVLKGSRWHIRNGEQVKIWSDNWIPSLPGFKPLNPIVPIDREALVSSLIDSDLGCWKLHTLKELFGDGDVSHIAYIPLSIELQDDKLIWDTEKNGEFSKVWKARNSVVFDKGAPCPMLVAKDVWLSSIELDSNLLVSTDRVMPSKVEATCGNSWIIQTDTGCFDGGIVSLGCVIRAANSEVLLAATQRITSFVAPGTAEALGIRWDLQLAKEPELDKVVLQSDALAVVDCINGVSLVLDLDPIVMDCRSFRSSLFSSTVMFIGRDADTDALSLVGIGKLVDSRTWLGVIPRNEEFPVVLANLTFF
ncbi:uncharacterized protein LOC131619526 [Vicia villosa]|uniref:uncharacterized protein LOC131619526 n=1 Tax=Vicia villosa TaxID=3911 RepID=UPI00273AB842|nr:uncharacterized protein LOC131619526 [Vicia villosa]